MINWVKSQIDKIAGLSGYPNNWQTIIDAVDDWVSVIDLNTKILKSNQVIEKYFHLSAAESIGFKCCKIVHGSDTPLDTCPFPKMLQTQKRESTEERTKDGRWMMVTVDPIFNGDGEMISAVHITRDITLEISLRKEREKIFLDLKKANIYIKTLSGLLPICSNCKKIRDHNGHWKMIESYIQNHSNVFFSHSICPECSEKLYGGDDWYIEMKKKEF